MIRLRHALIWTFVAALNCADMGPAATRKAAARPINYAVSAVQAAFAGRYTDAQRLAIGSGNSAARKLVEWVALRRQVELAGYERLMDFALANPDWPSAKMLRRRAEAMRRKSSIADRSAVRPAPFAAVKEPVNLASILAIARTSLEQNDRSKAQRFAKLAWRKIGDDPSAERRFLKKFGSLLSVDNHKDRLWSFLERGQWKAAIRAAKLLPPDYRQVGKIVRELTRGDRRAIGGFESLSATVRAETNMQYALARYYRRMDQYDRSAEILLHIDASKPGALDPRQVWTEREVVARELLGRSTPLLWSTSYAIVAAHGLHSGETAAEAEFLAGWIALRFLYDGQKALDHFQHLQSMEATDAEKARASYWLGRTYEFLGQGNAAFNFYSQAAQFPTLYYGQLAAEALGPTKTRVIIAEISSAKTVRDRIAREDIVGAYRILALIGRRNERFTFLKAFPDYFRAPEEMSGLAEIVWKLKGPYEALKLAKAAAAKGINIDCWNYPLAALPSWTQLGPPVEQSLLLGLARQESEFDWRAKSHVGAQGLLQLMPETAQKVAEQFKVPYDPEWLLNDAGYNVTLGAAHLADLVRRFKGSYVLALSAYNASPRRVLEWVKKNGDPRDPKVDAVDWIESIPFDETRHYVKQVLQNTQVYRSRLESSTMEGISSYLERGRAVEERAPTLDPCGRGTKGIDPLFLACW
jgi:soluble lytic murein transglycosylase